MFERLRKLFSTKESRTNAALVQWLLGQPIWTSTDYAALAKEGFSQNVYVFACVRQIAMACAGIPWVVYKKMRGGRVAEAPEDPLARLLERPNPSHGRTKFMENVVGYLMLAGNSYIEAVGPERGAPKELCAIRPDRMKVIAGNSQHLVAGYEYSAGTEKINFPPQAILHLQTFNPLDDWYGLSPIQVAARSVDQNNESRKWNVALLQNSARPPGALCTKANLTDEQFARLEAKLEEKYAGSLNAGRPLILEGGLGWEGMGLSPEDMAWLEGSKLSAREIAIAFDVPPELIGDTANKTYSNYKEARQALYTETILPLMDWLRDELNNWLTPQFADNLYLDYDRDEIEALQEDRDAVWKRAIEGVKTGVLSINEARLMLGYDEVPGGDVLMMPSNMMPVTVVTGGDMSEE